MSPFMAFFSCSPEVGTAGNVPTGAPSGSWQTPQTSDVAMRCDALRCVAMRLREVRGRGAPQLQHRCHELMRSPGDPMWSAYEPMIHDMKWTESEASCQMRVQLSGCQELQPCEVRVSLWLGTFRFDPPGTHDFDRIVILSLHSSPESLLQNTPKVFTASNWQHDHRRPVAREQLPVWCLQLLWGDAAWTVRETGHIESLMKHSHFWALFMSNGCQFVCDMLGDCGSEF